MGVDRRTVVAGLAAAVASCIAVVALHAVGIRLALTSALVGATVVTALAGLAARRHERLVSWFRRRSHHVRTDGTSIRVGRFAGTAFVGGLHRPEIFIDADTLQGLSDDERRAVLLHERHHQLRRDPLRVTLEALVRPVARTFPAGRRWLVTREADREIRADAYALRHGATASSLASALLKVGGAPDPLVPGFGSVIDLRVDALVGGSAWTPPRPYGHAAAAGFVLGLVTCLTALDHIWISCCV